MSILQKSMDYSMVQSWAEYRRDMEISALISPSDKDALGFHLDRIKQMLNIAEESMRRLEYLGGEITVNTTPHMVQEIIRLHDRVKHLEDRIFRTALPYEVDEYLNRLGWVKKEGGQE